MRARGLVPVLSRGLGKGTLGVATTAASGTLLELPAKSSASIDDDNVSSGYESPGKPDTATTDLSDAADAPPKRRLPAIAKVALPRQGRGGGVGKGIHRSTPSPCPARPASGGGPGVAPPPTPPPRPLCQYRGLVGWSETLAYDS